LIERFVKGVWFENLFAPCIKPEQNLALKY